MRRRTVAGLAATAAAAALVVGVSVVWPGLDAQETPKTDTAVWALQTAEGRRYARVNTAIRELDTVRSVSNPSQVAQTPDGAYLYSDSFSKLTRIDAALPIDLDEDALESSDSTPPGTTSVRTGGDFAAYVTDTGAVYAGRLSTGAATQLDPFPADDEDAPQYTADAITVDSRGVLFAYSRADGSVLTYDIAASEVLGRDQIAPTGLTAPDLTAAGDDWALVDTEDGQVWLEGEEAPIPTPLTGGVVVGQPDGEGSAVYLAGETGLVAVDVDDGAVTAEIDRGESVIGTPARPIAHEGEVFAAWLPQGEIGGLLWSSRTGEKALDFGGRALPDQRRPLFVASDDAVILNETRSGWVWTVPDGLIVPSSQDWTLDDRTDPAATLSEEELAVVIDPKPPVAESDAFGVRAGSLTSLSVLLNDHDPNEDVLAIDPDSISGLDPGFGTVSITDDGQRFAVRVAADAAGSATFSYAVTDGTSADGLRSEPTTVTLTVQPPSVDTSPAWCGVEGCLVEWPTPEVARGGTVTVPVLQGWVDPEGDPLLLLSVQNTSTNGSVAATPSGEVVYQHSDDGGTADELVQIDVTISDTTDGHTTTKPLLVRVAERPKLTVQSFAVIDTIDTGLTVDVAPHVTGTAGSLTLDSVRVLDDAEATATPVVGTTSFDFSAQAPGTFRVGFTVKSDGADDATGTARITILPADAPPQLATAPVVAFVHPKQDATLDVFAAVSNPTRRVLLLSDVVARADPGATLTVDAVGQSNLRVSGTLSSAETGRLGTVTYTISDGTDDAGARVEGEATVYLLPPAPELAPIAVDDTVVVRAGAQVDIPVLENDIAPAGGRPTVDPSSVLSSTDDALAFGSGDVVRYLAPEEPGEYGVDYSIFTTGAPALADTATVRIHVLPDDANRAPLPETLEGRVLSGQSTAIEFDGFGMDPDGDVVTLDRILVQPETGSATISADGASIIYSSVPGFRGQVSFRYRVVDASGETGEGTVRVGVLDGQSNPSPVTFTDYVQVQAGEGNTIRVSALANDIDPTGGELEITAVRPDLAETAIDGSESEEYTRWNERIASVADDAVVIEAGAEPGTMAFLYDVESTSGNTGRGLIVVKVVRESVPDYPVVVDTVLTVENREDFEDGVDVLEGKATWSGGDVADLEVGLWGDPDGVTVAGGRLLSGDLPARSRIIPFEVTGEGSSGEVTTYAFLRVPGEDDLALALKAGTEPPEVDELQSVAFDMARLVAVPRGQRIEVGDDVRASGARAAATCARETGTRVVYDAGAGAPWTDACQIPVRLAGQREWTYLTVPLLVRAIDPQPELRAGSLTVGPGETRSFDLTDLTSWQLGREDWDAIRYDVEYGGSGFDVSFEDGIVTVTGRDRAVPGSEELAMVSVTSHPDVAPARLILRVGAAPSTLPQGGSTAKLCSQAEGTSCTITVVGAPGEVNPLPRTPLEVVDVRATGACAGVSFTRASSSTVTASWTSDAPGASCTASFSVQDAQGRRTFAERDGRVTLDLHGYPKAPASIAQTGYANGTVTLRVDPGEARLAYPALEGFVVRSEGQVVTECDARGVCPDISAPNGVPRTYEAVAVNAVGESTVGVTTVAWAYDPPKTPTDVRAAPVVTGGEGGVVSLVIDGIDASATGGLEISSPQGDTVRVPVPRNQTRVDVGSYRVGTNSRSAITVTPYSRFEVPAGLGGSLVGGPATVFGNGIGAPLSPNVVLTSASNGDGTSSVTAVAAAALNGDGSSLRYGVVQSGQACTTTQAEPTFVFPSLQDGREYEFVMCAESWANDRVFGSATASATVRAKQSGRAPTGYTFVVDDAPDIRNGRAEWTIKAAPESPESPPRFNEAVFSGFPSGFFDRDPGIQVWYQHRFWGDESARANVVPAPGSAPYQLWANWSLGTCVGGATLARGGTSSSAEGRSAAITYSDADVVFRDGDGSRLDYTRGSWVVPVGAVIVQGIVWRASWDAWGLGAASTTLSATCDPNLPPPPDPEPTPTPTPTEPTEPGP